MTFSCYLLIYSGSLWYALIHSRHWLCLFFILVFLAASFINHFKGPALDLIFLWYFSVYSFIDFWLYLELVYLFLLMVVKFCTGNFFSSIPKMAFCILFAFVVSYEKSTINLFLSLCRHCAIFFWLISRFSLFL